MIKLRMHTKDGRDVILLGLSKANTARLHQDEPIIVRGADLLLPIDVFLVAGETEEEIVDHLREAGLDLPNDIIFPTHGTPKAKQ